MSEQAAGRSHEEGPRSLFRYVVGVGAMPTWVALEGREVLEMVLELAMVE